jgi:hypothetical protein
MTTPVLQNVPVGTPSALRVQVYGDGSGHRLTLRLLDSTDEAFVINTGPVNWTGWRQVEVRDPEKWSHFGGNNNGVFDGSVSKITIAIDQTAGGPPTGRWYFDDLTLVYGDETHLAAGFEDAFRSLKVHMLAAEGTTVITGQGLGPDLRVPVPYVLARRQAQQARFVTLLEPFQSDSQVTSFTEIEPGIFEITTPTYTDRIQFRNGDFGFVRELL